ncbi:hypothetical protein Ato02nite_047200 [Paractinoplanes toevensis]|uniref:Uncharacterized protein n=1 Tax=Paractinoplanes toevensis TaxID=571911 RepID=A0A919W1W6_9ACTN|nr:hypothetical protein Ato02nite_047200 [Actinoplanes toevensis]
MGASPMSGKDGTPTPASVRFRSNPFPYGPAQSRGTRSRQVPLTLRAPATGGPGPPPATPDLVDLPCGQSGKSARSALAPGGVGAREVVRFRPAALPREILESAALSGV